MTTFKFNQREPRLLNQTTIFIIKPNDRDNPPISTQTGDLFNAKLQRKYKQTITRLRWQIQFVVTNALQNKLHLFFELFKL